ncbi:hypothetical protein [Nocardia nova]|uniref:hypothetical protein n=1 Tax=Nocardia nova TaxID=37330 RepID=UPI000CEA6D48|nr:hypothetical protein [Nocardia nova]PPI89039.1 hypothetical protein C5E46_35320 [Nocardia nova]
MATIVDKPPTEEDEKKRKRSAALERGATLFTAAIASAVAAQGMYVFFSQALGMPTPLLVMCFSFIELMVITSAMRARRSQIDTGSAGVDGIAMWVLTIASGILAATHADDTGTLLLRLMAPLIAAWGWERSMKLERRQLTGEDVGLNWRWSPQRLLVRWGIADPTDRTTAEVAVERRLADLARAADNVRLAQTTGRSARHERKMVQRLHRAIDKAADDGVVLGEPEIRRRLREHLEGRFAAYTLPKYRPLTDWSNPEAIDAPARESGEAAIDPRAIDDQLAEFEREFAARAPRATEAPIAREPIADRGDDTARATDRIATDRAPIAREEAPAPRAEHPTVVMADRAQPIVAEPVIARAEQAAPTLPTEPIAREIPRAEAESIAAHSPADLGSDTESIADRGTDSSADNTEPTDSTATVVRDRGPVVSLVRANDSAPVARAVTDRARTGERDSSARGTAVDGALARATDRGPRAESSARGNVARGPFAREMSQTEADRLARAVIDRGKSKQPAQVLAAIYRAHSQGQRPNAIGKLVELPHSTVGRAIDAAHEVAGPRKID